MPPPPFITCKYPYRETNQNVDADIQALLLKARLLVCHGIDSIDVQAVPGRAPWVELKQHIGSQAALFFACSNTQRMLRPCHRRLPPEIVEMVFDFLVETSYVCMANNVAMQHLARLPTGLPPITNVRVPVIHIRDLALVQQLTPEELAGACVETTETATPANLTLTFLTTDGTVGALHYR